MSPTPERDPRADNALKFGLFAAAPYVREHEREDFDHMATALRKDIRPAGALEELLTSEIISASWRLRRCNMVEAHLATQTGLDPMALDNEYARIQKSVDRARAQSHTTIRRSMAELRKLQTERTLREELHLATDGLEDIAKVLQAIKANPFMVKAAERPNVRAEPPANLFCKKPERNQPCPCGSRIKYKKCCGNPVGPSAAPRPTATSDQI